MVFDARFQHYLSYGAADQQTVRELKRRFTGLLVPGTIAAFQREGTGGFVLSLSATEAETPYVIDPRFPLFQQKLEDPKKSHITLAEVFGEPDLIAAHEPHPATFTDELVDKIAENWVQFNDGYKEAVSQKFEKYALRLNEEVLPAGASGPKYVLAPYTTCEGVHDAWWDVSVRLFERTVAHVGDAEHCIRVVAAKSAEVLSELLEASDSERMAIWVSGLNELTTAYESLGDYAEAIHVASRDGRQLFALYGGFFSVMLSSLGLGGSSHGIGFGEFRDYLELPRSGPPPSRYYLPQIHRYVSQELAFALWRADPALAECPCEACDGEPPIGLDYHSLMMHSVLCRALEIEEWVGLDLRATQSRLTTERGEFLRRLSACSANDFVKGQALASAGHLQVWIDALGSISDR